MPKDWKTFDLEDRLIDFAVRIIRIAESLPKGSSWNEDVAADDSKSWAYEARIKTWILARWKQPVDFDICDTHSDCETKDKKNFIIRHSLFDIHNPLKLCRLYVIGDDRGRDRGRCQFVQLIACEVSGTIVPLSRSLAHQGFAKILDISTGMPAVFVPPQAGLHQDLGTSLPPKSLNLGKTFMQPWSEVGWPWHKILISL